MTMNDRNVRMGHRAVTSCTGMADDARAAWHLSTDIGIGPRHISWWNSTWMALARCRDMDPSLFFPSDAGGERTAQRICAVCPVKIPCLEYSLVNRMDDGVWGGRSERERLFLRLRR